MTVPTVIGRPVNELNVGRPPDDGLGGPPQAERRPA
jgi:hypothetical protein